MIDVMYRNYHYFKYLVMLFTLLGFHLFMLKKYYLSFVYCNCFILFTCKNIFIFNFLLLLYIYRYTFFIL